MNATYRNLFLIILVITGWSCPVYSQGAKNIIQFSGLVVGGDSLYGIPGVYVTIPKAGRGTITNETGFFSIPTLVGDSIEISAVGYKKKRLGIPPSDKKGYTVIIEMQEDTTYYPIVEIFPYPTEELFKRAFLSLNTRNQNITNMYANVDVQVLQRILINTAMSASENQKYSLRNQMYLPGQPVGSGGFNLNPFAWGSVLRQARNKEYKKKIFDE